MATDFEKTDVDTFRLFPSSEDTKSQLGLGFLDSFKENPLPPPPSCIEVLPSEVLTSGEFSVEPISFGGLNLLKGRVSTNEVFALSNLDLVPGKYEGGLKLWEGSLDLIKALLSEVQDEQINFKGKRVLELGCGHGLPGIYAIHEGAAVVHFQDFNAEVLRCLTIPNVNANISQDILESKSESEIRYFAGDWGEVHQLLVPLYESSGQEPNAGYDIILMAETVYSVSSLHSLYKLIKKCINRPNGVIYMAAKKHYFGVGGGTRRFLSVVEKDGIMAANLVAEVADGSSNVREVWKLSLK